MIRRVVGMAASRPSVFMSLLALLLALAACEAEVATPWSEPPALLLDLRITVEPQEVALLQPVTVTLDRYRQDNVEVAFTPEVDDALFLTRSTTTEPESEFGAGHWQRTTLILLPIAGPGELTLRPFTAEVVPASAVDGTGSAIAPVAATTPEQTITVLSSLVDHGKEIEAPGEPFPTPFGGWWWLAGGTAVLVLCVFAYLRRGDKQPSPSLEVALPPHVKALRELQRLRGCPRTTPGEIESFYVGTSHVLRVYLEERFGLHAPERTTEEFLRDLEGSDQLLRQHRRELERFLSQCDLVKFAALVPTEGEHETIWLLAESFVESTRVDRVGRAPSPPAAEALSESSP